MYVDYEYYKSFYGDKAIPETDFNRIYKKIIVYVNKAVKGIDNVNKLKVAFPTDADDADAVRMCVIEMIDKYNQVEQKMQSINETSGYIKREDGSLVGKVITSVSAGNESVGYSSQSKTGETWIDKAVADNKELKNELNGIIMDYLSGIADANGVNLLYTGRYPYRLEKQ